MFLLSGYAHDMLSRKGSSAGVMMAQSGVDRTRVGERLHAALAGLQELHLLRDRQGEMVTWALRADREEPVTSVRLSPEGQGGMGPEEQRLEATLSALKQQLSRLRKQDVGLKTHLQQLDQQINDLKLDVNKVSTDQQETDSRPSSGFYELSDGGSGSLSNSCTSVYSACLSSPQATLPTSPPNSQTKPHHQTDVSRRRSADESTTQSIAPRMKAGLHLGSCRIRANTEKARPRPVSTGDLERMMGQMQNYNKPVDTNSFSKLSFESGTDTISSQHSHRKPSEVVTVFPEVSQKEVSTLPPLPPPPPPVTTTPQTTNVVPALDNDQKRHYPTQEAADNTNQYKQLLRTHKVSHRLSFPADTREYSSDEVTTSTLKKAIKMPIPVLAQKKGIALRSRIAPLRNLSTLNLSQLAPKESRYPAAPYHMTSRYPPRCESEYSAECASLFHSTIAASSDGEMSDHTTNRFGDSESSQSYQSLSDSDSSLSFDEEDDFLDEEGGFQWANASMAPTTAGCPVQQPQQQQPQQPPRCAPSAPSACRIKASRALKKKIRRFQPASMKVMTLV
uniref:Uncharacterized protein n=1 Tax=Knipowitschia caucasica TaxID=637954 RepID=A0AAV2JLI6_KNICA